MQKLMEKIWPFSYKILPPNGSLEQPLLSSSSGVDAQTLENLSPNLRIFTMNELQKATHNFCSSNKLGKDDISKKYKGWIINTELGERNAVSIRKFSENRHSNEECLKEIQLLSQLEHPNLVRVLGYCLENNNNPAIVSEYMPQGSLEDNLFKKDFGTKLTWTLRMKIALGAATGTGLAFLLNSEPSVLYWNAVTSFNILLDSDYSAKLCDFRYDKIIDNLNHRVTLYFHRFAAYATPEFVRTAFDINMPPGKQRLVDWVYRQIRKCKSKSSEEQGCRGDQISEELRKSGLLRVIDSHYGGNYPFQGAVRLFAIAVACTQDDLKARANMEEVIKAWEALQENKE